uniref:Mobilization protein MobB n=1 Tax=mine drainage metagenome TaxID=410659 RepID=E6PP72_9ZZZZ
MLATSVGRVVAASTPSATRRRLFPASGFKGMQSSPLPVADPTRNATRQDTEQATQRPPQKRVEIRWARDDYQAVVHKAQACGLTLSAFIRRATMGRRITTLTDQTAIAELRRLGGLLKHLYPKQAHWTAQEKKRYWAGYEQLLEVAKAIERRL